MIPKIIHYCWFGNSPLPPLAIKCIKSWRKHCPDYEIKEWNETNYDITKNKYMHEAYQNKKWGFVPDYARLDIIYKYGGIYFDTDVEVIKNLDALLQNEAYAGFESEDMVALGLGFAAKKEMSIIKELRDVYETIHFDNQDGTLNLTASPVYQTNILVKNGLITNNTMQIVNDMQIYPTEYFSPLKNELGVFLPKKNTYTIHHYMGSWLDGDKKKWNDVRIKLGNVFGRKIGNKIGNFFYVFSTAGFRGIWKKIRGRDDWQG